MHTNHGELFRIFDTFCRVWRAGGQATLTTSTEGGLLKANLDIQLGPPTAACPGAPPPHLQRQTAWTSPSSSTPVPGHPGAGSWPTFCQLDGKGGSKAESRSEIRQGDASSPAPSSPPLPPTPVKAKFCWKCFDLNTGARAPSSCRHLSRQLQE